MKNKKSVSLTKSIRWHQVRFYFAILLAVFILVSSLVNLLMTNLAAKETSPLMREGFLDLSEQDFDKNTKLELNGEWRFYPGHFILPSADPEREPDGDFQLVQLPGPWELADGAAGFGSYRLVIALPGPEVYGLRTKTIRSASRLFVNGQQVTDIGQVGEEAGSYRPASRFGTGFAQSRGGKMELVLHVSNFYYNRGGVLAPIEFGTAQGILNRTNREIGFEMMVVFSFVTVSILTFILFLLRQRKRELLYFSLGCFSMGLYLSLTNNQIFRLLLDISFMTRAKMQLVAMIGVMVCFLSFVEYFFRRVANRKICRAIKGLILIGLAGLFVDPYLLLSWGRQLLPILMNLVLFASFGYMAVVMIKAMLRKLVAVEFVLVAVVSLASYWISMGVKMVLDWKIPHYSEWMLIFVLVSMVFLIGERLRADYLEMTELTEKRLEREFDYFFSQISPHFVYNTINTIIGLSYEDSERTREALNYLALYFRGKLDFHMERGLIPLETELEMVVAYLEIEKMRYGDKLQIQYEIEDDLDGQIPPLTIQPLAENAIKHGIASLDSEGTVRIMAGRTGDGYIRITVEDDGVGMPPDKRERILKGESRRLGLQNIIRKISIMPEASIDFAGDRGQGTLVQVTIPERGLHGKSESRSD